MFSFLLVDDHSIVRTGLKKVLKKEFYNASIDEACDETTAFKSIKSKIYTLLVIDINLKDLNPVNFISTIKIIRPDIKILVFTANSEMVFAKKYFKIGINGYLNKKAENIEIIDAIRIIMSNNNYLSSDLKNYLSSEALNGIIESPFTKLSSREFDVALLLMQGKRVTEISKILYLHTSSIATYKCKIFEKCQVHNILELYILAKENGVV